MQFQVKTRIALTLFITIFTAKMTRADEFFWQSLETDKISVENYSSAQGEVISSYVPYFKDLGQYLWSWNPSEELKKTTEITYREPISSMSELMKNLFIEFDVSDTEHFRKIWFKPKPDLQFRGLLGLHDFKSKRPFIILRMGVHGNVDELIAERFLVKLIYEDLDANFLVLESLTSHAFLSKNKNISIGGVDEGLQTFVAITELSKTKIHSLISTQHLMSVSMGGQGTFITALLDENNGRKISSILNFCPLINLKETFEYHNKAESNFKNAVIDLWNVRRLRSVFDIYKNETSLNTWWKTIFDFKPRFTSAVLDLLNRDRARPLLNTEEIEKIVLKIKWPKDLKNHLNNSRNFYELNNFWSLYRGVTTPMTIYTTPNDPLVLNKLNSELIFKGMQPGDFSNLKYLRLERGVHCGLAPVYSWEYLVKIVKQGLEL